MSENGEDRQSEDGAAISDLSALDEVLLTSSTLRTSADRAQELGNETPTVQDYGHEAVVEALSGLFEVAGDLAPVMRTVADDMENRARQRHDAPPAPETDADSTGDREDGRG